MKHATSGGEGGELKCTAASGDCNELYIYIYHYLKSGLSDQQEMV